MNKLQQIRESKGMSRDELAERLGTTATTIYRKETGMRGLKTHELKAYANALGCNPGDLVDDAGSSEASLHKPMVRTGEETILVPAYDVALSAGGGALIEQENIRYHLTFRLDWIRRITNAPLEMLAVLDVDGDSMLPTLAPGDSVLIDLTQTYPKRDGIHALRYDGAALIKRVQIDPVRQRASIISDNPAYPPITDIDPRDIQVLGRALWIGRRV